MINPKIYNINLDLKNTMYTSDIKVKQGDIDSNIFKLKLIQDNQEYDLTGLTAKAFFIRPDKAESYLDAPITDALKGEIEITLTNQILNAKGWATCEVKVFGTEGEVLSTMIFGFTIMPSMDYTQVESSNEFDALISAIAEVKALDTTYAPRLGSVESQLAETMNKTAITLNHIFADNTARDTYFTSKPVEKINLTFIKVGTGYQQLINGVWTIANPILVEAVNQIDDANTGTTKTLSASKELALLALKADKAQEAWISPTLLNGWLEFDSARPPRYKKNSFGLITLTGLVKSGVPGSAIFSLSFGYQPLKFLLFPIAANGSISVVQVGNDGFVTPLNSENSYISLDGVSFYLD